RTRGASHTRGAGRAGRRRRLGARVVGCRTGRAGRPPRRAPARSTRRGRPRGDAMTRTNARPAVLALDQGTTSTRALVVDEAGTVVAGARREHAQHFPRPGWVEHDALEIWTCVREVLAEA